MDLGLREPDYSREGDFEWQYRIDYSGWSGEDIVSFGRRGPGSSRRKDLEWQYHIDYGGRPSKTNHGNLLSQVKGLGRKEIRKR